MLLLSDILFSLCLLHSGNYYFLMNIVNVYFIFTTCSFLIFPITFFYNSLPKYCFGHSLIDALAVVTSCISTLSETSCASHSLLRDNLTTSTRLRFLAFFLLSWKITRDNTVLWTVKVSIQNYVVLVFTKSFKYFHGAERHFIVNPYSLGSM